MDAIHFSRSYTVLTDFPTPCIQRISAQCKMWISLLRTTFLQILHLLGWGTSKTHKSNLEANEPKMTEVSRYPASYKSWLYFLQSKRLKLSCNIPSLAPHGLCNFYIWVYIKSKQIRWCEKLYYQRDCSSIHTRFEDVSSFTFCNSN